MAALVRDEKMDEMEGKEDVEVVGVGVLEVVVEEAEVGEMVSLVLKVDDELLGVEFASECRFRATGGSGDLFGL